MGLEWLWGGDKQARDSPDVDEESQRPSDLALADEAIDRAILEASVLHPLTIIPIVGVVLGCGAGLMLEVSLGWGVAILSALGMVGAFFYNWKLRAGEFATRYVRETQELFEYYRRRDAEDIAEQCKGAGFENGAKEAVELHEAYSALMEHLQRRVDGEGDYSKQRFQMLAGNSYGHAVAKLRRALGIYETSKQIPIDTIERERREAEERLGQAGEVSGRERQTDERTVEAHTRVIDRYREQQAELEDLVAESNEVEQELRLTLMEIASRQSAKELALYLSEGNPVRALRSAVDGGAAAERRASGRRAQTPVQERLSRLAAERRARRDQED